MNTLDQRNARALGGSSNYPCGAEHDPRAPWNQTDPESCPKCDGEAVVPCAECHGTPMPILGCARCDGTGTEPCELCDGTGHEHQKTRDEIECEKADAARDEAKDEPRED